MYVTPFTCMTPNMKFCHVNMAQSRKIDPSVNQIILLNFWLVFFQSELTKVKGRNHSNPDKDSRVCAVM